MALATHMPPDTRGDRSRAVPVPAQPPSGPVAGHQRQLDDVPAPTGAVERLHWTLDVTFGEDRARNRKDNGPENLTILRKLTLNVLGRARRDSPVRRKRKRSGWSNNFARSIIGQMR